MPQLPGPETDVLVPAEHFESFHPERKRPIRHAAFSTRSPETQSNHVTMYHSSSFSSCGSGARLSDSQSYPEYYLRSSHGRPQKNRGPFRSRGFYNISTERLV